MTRSVRALGVMGKAPEAGAVKTRLSPPLDPYQAAQLYGAFLRDTLLTALTVPDAVVYLFHPPVDDHSTLTDLAPGEVACVEDLGSGLGEGMHQAFQHCFDRHATAVVLIGADLPTLPASLIEAAFAALERAVVDVVLGPSVDGGYYLIGLRVAQSVLFDGMVWSTPNVLTQTLDRSRQADLAVELLDPWHDIDGPADLMQLVEDLAEDSALAAPNTRQTLSEIRPAITPDQDYG